VIGFKHLQDTQMGLKRSTLTLECVWWRWVGDAMILMVIVVMNGERAVVSTLAGGVSGTNSAYIDASGINAGFNYPWGVAVDASGNVFVGDRVNQRIRKVTVDGGTRIGLVTLRACSVEINVDTLFCLPPIGSVGDFFLSILLKYCW
jgi:hypothetical protein